MGFGTPFCIGFLAILLIGFPSAILAGISHINSFAWMALSAFGGFSAVLLALFSELFSRRVRVRRTKAYVVGLTSGVLLTAGVWIGLFTSNVGPECFDRFNKNLQMYLQD